MSQKLKTYNSEAEVPTEHKAFYATNSAGKWEPQVEGVESVSGLVAKRDELLGKVSGHAAELTGKDAEIQRLSGQLANASTSTIPRGHKAVPSADAELVEAVKAAGVTSLEAFNTLKAEHGDYKQRAAAATKRESLDSLRKKLGWGEGAIEVLSLIPDLPEWEDRDAQVNGKTEKVPHAKVKEGDALTYKPFADFFKEKHAALLPSVQAEKKAEWITQGDGHPPAGKKLSDSIIQSQYANNAKPAAAGN